MKNKKQINKNKKLEIENKNILNLNFKKETIFKK